MKTTLLKENGEVERVCSCQQTYVNVKGVLVSSNIFDEVWRKPVNICAKCMAACESEFLNLCSYSVQPKRASFVDVVTLPIMAMTMLLYCIPVDKEGESHDFSGVRVRFPSFYLLCV